MRAHIDRGSSSARPTRRRRISALASVILIVGVMAGCLPHAPTDPGHSRINLRVLVIDDASPMVGAIVDELKTEGIPHTDIELSNPTRTQVTPSFLASGSDAHYQAVVLPDESGGGLSSGELAAIHTFASAFDIRLVDAFTFANVNIGLDPSSPMYNGDLDGMTATVTAAGKQQGFGYLNGPVHFDIGSYASVAPPVPTSQMPAHSEFTTLVSAPIPSSGGSGSILGVYRSGGFEQLVITAAFDSTFTQFRALGHGIVSWATRGIHLGYDRNYFSIEVDDIFNTDSLWDPAHHCTPGEDCPLDEQGNSIYPGTDARMTPADVNALVAWQQQNDFALQMVFNAGLASPTDPLTNEFLKYKSHFWWINHTWEHEFLGCAQDFTVIPWQCATDSTTGVTEWQPESLTVSEINQNIAWAQQYGLPFDPTELVSGEYSGLQIPGTQPTDNPNFVAGIAATGIKWLASDVSRGEFTPRNVGGATTTPRYPLNIFYNAATEAQEVSEYNWLYTSVADGGSGYCTDHPATTTCIMPLDPDTGFSDYIVPLEASLRMPDILHNDPRSTMIHQTNLTGDRIILPVLDSILSTYRSLMTPATPIVNPTPTQTGTTLLQQETWSSLWSTTPNSSSAVNAYYQGGVVTVTGPVGTAVPVTVPAGTTVVGNGSFGTSYGGEQSAWATLGDAGLALAIPAGTNANPTAPPAPTGVTVAAMADGSLLVSWATPITDNGRPADFLLVATAPNEPTVVGSATGGSTSATLSGLDPAASYSVAVYAVSSAGTSPPSTTASSPPITTVPTTQAGTSTTVAMR